MKTKIISKQPIPFSNIMQKYQIKTFGCQMNRSDSERIASFLESCNFIPLQKNNKTDSSSKISAMADLIVFNTCGVRQMAEDRVYGQIHNLRKNNLKIMIVLTGCMAHRKDVQKKLANKVDLFCKIKDFPKKLGKLLTTNYELKTTKNESFAPDYFHIKPKNTNSFQALVPIMTGCNNFCAYCVVPYARGHEISRPVENVLKEVETLVKNGHKEITLLGQNVNSYKSQNSKIKTINFSELLRIINDIPGNFWIRFLTSHPKDMSDELIETIAKCEKVCEYVHLPIQSGNDEILRKMNRKYTSAQYLKLIEKMRDSFHKHKPNTPYAITTDIIVGFPEETKKQFEDSIKVMKKVSYDMAFIAQFSPRPETTSWNMQDNIPREEKRNRDKKLVNVLEKTALKKNEEYIKKTVNILVEKKRGEFCYGRTRTMKNVRFQTICDSLVGKFAKVKIIKARIWSLEGKLS